MPTIARLSLRSLTALTLLTGLALPAVAQEAPIKIAVVNLDAVVAQSPGGKALQVRLEQFQQQAQVEIEALVGAARDLRERATQGANSLSAEQLAELQRQFEDKQLQMTRMRDDKTREGQKIQNEGLAAIEQQLGPVFDKLRTENGYDLILNNVAGVVVMTGPRVDITQLVLDRLNNP